MTTKEFMRQADLTWPKAIMWVFGLGMIVGAAKVTVADKVDKWELRWLSDSLKIESYTRDRANERLSRTIDSVAKDVRTIKLLLCGRASIDSFCHGGTQ